MAQFQFKVAKASAVARLNPLFSRHEDVAAEQGVARSTPIGECYATLHPMLRSIATLLLRYATVLQPANMKEKSNIAPRIKNKNEAHPMSARKRLPNRRPSHIETLEAAGQTFTACIGFDPETGRPREIFLNGGKEGSQVDAMLADAATIISVALQYGVPPAAFRKSVGRSPNLATMSGSSDQLMAGDHAASPIGAAVDLLCSFERGPVKAK